MVYLAQDMILVFQKLEIFNHDYSDFIRANAKLKMECKRLFIG